MRQPIHYPIGSISSGTMRPEDLIPTFCAELGSLAKRGGIGIVSAKGRKEHLKLVREIETRIQDEREFEDIDLGIEGMADYDLESLFGALGEYAGPYFYFGAHPGDGADYGWWLSENWEEDFIPLSKALAYHANLVTSERNDAVSTGIKVNDLADVPKWFRGEVAVVSDHGNVTLWVKTSRGMREIWSVV